MNVQEIRDKTVDELNKQLLDLKDELFHLRFQHAINQLDNPRRLTVVKRDIARVKTVLTQKEMQEKGGKEQ